MKPKAEPAPKRATKAKKKLTPAQEADKHLELAAQAGLLGLIINAVFYGLSQFRGDHWRLREDELLELSHKTTLAINSALPESYLEKYDATLKQYAPILAAVSTGATIIAKRVQQDRIIAAQAKGLRAVPGNGRANVGVTPEPLPVVPHQSDDRGQTFAGVGNA